MLRANGYRSYIVGKESDDDRDFRRLREYEAGKGYAGRHGVYIFDKDLKGNFITGDVWKMDICLKTISTPSCFYERYYD
ncbi:MAG: hypothetical protein JSC189_000904 [Candidatus Tokpelaia sp. JSC189]|nr:MAG: hypothetical protein JSC189_000928 [Candidatus Tokpelaia sp. JSC189]RCL01037.1 MAG: hypothetical protein JSC189_000923 [Candidatus Tokpelaia sp. JSC189]RCL01040.1 MAG: hypothetical protein JSC189_000914 [Candidatus Tokpelaia sp. JSC189]RCL01128.1 MAG: hypothetical protein JSC189_000909 [Candidatus Tokpelaia sp. JSC189]RCL01836.1 MAG: hypothetical protein JSC189_000904 [Candidatus Tokpelaia sp. JSC189]